MEAITWKKNELLSLEFVDRLWNRDISSLSSNGSDLEKRRWKCLRRSRTRSRRPWQGQFCAFGSRRSKYGHGTRFEPNICLKGTTGAIVWLPNEWVWRSAILKKLGLGPRESWRLPSSKPISYCCRAHYRRDRHALLSRGKCFLTRDSSHVMGASACHDRNRPERRLLDTALPPCFNTLARLS